MENKRQRFVRMAEKRVDNAINTISLLGNLSNRNNYEYSEKDIKQIFKVIRDELVVAENRFYRTATDRKKFKLES